MAGDHSSLRVLDIVPAGLSVIFPFESFNAMQSIVARQLVETPQNVVVAAPTGSGKTVLHELAILRLLMRHSSDKLKALMIAPNKALCQQRVLQWREKFQRFGIVVIELTGDTTITQGLRSLVTANIIVTTPEKWDALTRSWRKHMYLLGAIDLLLLDEIHHLGEDRGAVLETVVVRLRILNETVFHTKKGSFENNQKVQQMRIVALSATLPNIKDVGQWLQCDPAAVHYFDESFRPVPLTTHVCAFPAWKNPFLFEQSLDSKVFDIVRNYSDGKQTLIFCSSKKGAEKLCLLLSKHIRLSFTRDSIANSLSESKLRHAVSLGMAWHHAGLLPDDRTIIERLFLNGNVQILCTTTTLAHGVNLPAHLVIVKGTNMWRGKGYEKLPRSTVLQMIGRAGRPGFDTSGVAVIMTSQEDKLFYESAQMDIVESALPSCLIEALCVEVCQGVLQDLSDVMMWLKRTYFYIRVLQNKAYYGFPSESKKDTSSVVSNICVGAINDLAEAKILSYDSETLMMVPQYEAFVMTRHVIKFKSMKKIMSMEQTWGVAQLLRGICFVEEAEKPLRRDEKKILNEMMKHVRFPLKVRVATSDLKAYVLIQSAVSKTFIVDFSLRIEQADIVEQLARVLLALQEHCIERGKGKLLESCVLVRRALVTRQWENQRTHFFEQFDDISDSLKSSLRTHHASDDDHNVPVCYSDLNSSTVQDVRRKYMCSNEDAAALLRHISEAKNSAFSVKTSRRNSQLCFLVSHAEVEKTIDTSKIPNVLLIAYEITSGKLLCYRILTPLTKSEITVPVHNIENSSIQISLLNYNLAGLDWGEINIFHEGAIQNLSSVSLQNKEEDTDDTITANMRMAGVKVRSKSEKVQKKKRRRDEIISDDIRDGYNYKAINNYMITEQTRGKVENIEEKENDFSSFNCNDDNQPPVKSIPRELQLLREKAFETNYRNPINTHSPLIPKETPLFASMTRPTNNSSLCHQSQNSEVFSSKGFFDRTHDSSPLISRDSGSQFRNKMGSIDYSMIRHKHETRSRKGPLCLNPAKNNNSYDGDACHFTSGNRVSPEDFVTTNKSALVLRKETASELLQHQHQVRQFPPHMPSIDASAMSRNDQDLNNAVSSTLFPNPLFDEAFSIF